MTDLDKIAREFMDSMPDSSHGRAADFPEHSFVVLESEAFYAVRAALLTAPPGWRLVPVEPTGEMLCATEDIEVGGSRDACLDYEARNIWVAMLAAAPATAETGKESLQVQPAEIEHDFKDVRCGCCGYMTYHREHMGCIRAAIAAEKGGQP